MDTIITAPASCKVCAVIRLPHAEGQSMAEIHEFMAPGTTIMSEVYCETRNKLQRSIQNKWRGMLTKGIVLLHDNARHHTTAHTNALIKLFNWEFFDHPPHRMDMVPSDYHLFTKMKVWLAIQRFHTNKELMDGVNNWLHNLAAPFFDKGL
jgi:transposase